MIIDTIHRLEIVTTTRELYVEESPEVYEVRAYDDQGLFLSFLVMSVLKYFSFN